MERFKIAGVTRTANDPSRRDEAGSWHGLRLFIKDINCEIRLRGIASLLPYKGMVCASADRREALWSSSWADKGTRRGRSRGAAAWTQLVRKLDGRRRFGPSRKMFACLGHCLCGPGHRGGVCDIWGQSLQIESHPSTAGQLPLFLRLGTKLPPPGSPQWLLQRFRTVLRVSANCAMDMALG